MKLVLEWSMIGVEFWELQLQALAAPANSQ